MTATLLERKDLTRGTARVLAKLRVHGKAADGTARNYVMAPCVIPDASEKAEPRVVSLGYYERTASGDDGALRFNTCTVVVADIKGPGQTPDYLFRAFLDSVTQYGVINADVEIEWITEADWRVGKTWATYFRGEVARYKPVAGYLFQLELKGWGSRRADRAFALPKLADDFLTLPTASAKLYAPLLLGRISDEGAQVDTPTPVAEAASGAYTGPDWTVAQTLRVGLASLGGVVPTGLAMAPVAANGGHWSTSPSDATAYTFFGMVAYTPPGGSIGDPDTFLPVNCQQFTGLPGADATVDMSCVAIGTGGTYSFFLGALFNNNIQFGARIDSASPAASFAGDSAIDGSTSLGVQDLRAYVAAWLMPGDMRSGFSAPYTAANFFGYARPYRMTFAGGAAIPVGALGLRVWRTRYGVTGTDRYGNVNNITADMLERQYDVPLTQVNGASDLYFENLFTDNATGTAVESSEPAQLGRLPLVAIGGPYADAAGVAIDWQFFALSYGWESGDAIEGIYQVPSTAAAGDPRVRVPDASFLSGGSFAAPGFGDWTTLFGPNDYLTVNGRRYWGIYVRGVDAVDALSGDRPILVNAGRANTNGFDQLALVLDNFVLPDQVQPVGGGAWAATIPAWTDTKPRRDAASFSTTETEALAVMASGPARCLYVAAADARPTCAEILQRMLVGLDVGMYWTNDGAAAVVLHPPAPFLATFAPSLTHINEILDDPAFDVEDDESIRANAQPFNWSLDPVSGAYAGSDSVANADALAAYDDFDPVVADALELSTVMDPIAAAQIAYRHLLRRSKPDRTVTLARAFHAIHQEIGTRPLLTHPEGLALGGYLNRRAQVRSVLADLENLRVTWRLHDLDWIGLAQRVVWLLVEEDMGWDLGGSRVDSCITDGGRIKPANWKRAYIDWDVYAAAGIAVVGLARFSVSTAIGSVTVEIRDASDNLIDTSSAVTPSAMTDVTADVPSSSGSKVYHAELVLAGGATADTVLVGEASFSVIPA